MTLGREFLPSDLIVLRTPLLPFEEVEAWSAGLLAPAAAADEIALAEALTHDRALLRGRLATLLDRPEIAEAIFLASPDLSESLAQWRREPESKKGRRTEHGLVRYFLRMASRPTPFGLFAGVTAGHAIDPSVDRTGDRTGHRTRLALVDRAAYRRHSRLDMDYLFALCEHLSASPEARAELRFRPNSSLYEAGGRLRFAEARVAGRLRTYHLVAVDSFDALTITLQRAADGARLDDLAAALVAGDPDGEITPDDANAFLHDLVDNQLLVAELALPVTGEESTSGLIRQLATTPSARGVREILVRAEQTLATIDAEGQGTLSERYRELARGLEPLGVPVELSRLFQVDLVKPAGDVVIGEAVTAEILRGVEILHHFPQSRVDVALEEFRAAFTERYGAEREVPLLAALDEESGIGFERSSQAAAEASPLLAGLSFVPRGDHSRTPWGLAEVTLLELLAAALTEGRTEVVLSEENIRRLENPDRPPLPDAFHVTATLAAASAEAVDRGEFRVLLHSAMGPSGARMLGRFCHADDAIRSGVEAHLAAEEALVPDAIFAEIVHLPAGRLGNILSRPILRGYEIAFLGRSGAPAERQIALDDLLVTVIGDRIRLRSKRLGREIIPRLTTAHNTTGESLGAYRFLAALQRPMGMEWTWGPLESAPFLPRVVSGRLVLSRARWRLTAADIKPLAAVTGDARYRFVHPWRAERRLPRLLLLADSDNELLVDFDNPLVLDSIVDLIKNRDEVTLMELYPAPDELCVTGPDGRFVHELVVPFTRRAADAPRPAGSDAEQPAASLPAAFRTFAPGSEWLYARLYTGTATADRILREELMPLAAEALASGTASAWFFIRYSDPNWHLRVRFHGDPARLRDTVQPELEQLFRRLLAAGSAWKFQFDTYEREVERYGGATGIAIAEQLFFHDSVAVLAMLDSCGGDAGSGVRWRLMLLGVDRLLGDFGLDLNGKLRFAEESRDGFARRYRFELLRERLADRLRQDRPALDRLLEDPVGAPEDLEPGLAALDRRSAANAPLVAQLDALERRGELLGPVTGLLSSCAHMFVNRLSRSAGPEHEVVIYDYLAQLYRSRLARASKRGRTTEARLVAAEA